MRAFLLALAVSTLIAAPALACGTASKTSAPISRIGADLDAHLAKAQLSEADLAKVRDLRAKIETALADKKFSEAWDAETAAMDILGYDRVVSRCAPSSWRLKVAEHASSRITAPRQ